jgi:hypothetical protein
LVVLAALSLDIDVQALGTREILQGTKKFSFLPRYIVRKNRPIYFELRKNRHAYIEKYEYEGKRQHYIIWKEISNEAFTTLMSMLQ